MRLDEIEWEYQGNRASGHDVARTGCVSAYVASPQFNLLEARCGRCRSVWDRGSQRWPSIGWDLVTDLGPKVVPKFIGAFWRIC